MRKLLLALSALAVFGLAAPVTTPAAAEEGKVIIKARRHHPVFLERRHQPLVFERRHRPLAFGRFHDRDRFRDRDHDRKSVVIKKREY